MRTFLISGLTVATLFAAGAAQARGSEVAIKDAAARVVVIPEDRSDVRVEMVTTNPGLPLTVRTDGARVVVDGGLPSWALGRCRTVNNATSVAVRRKRYDWADIPQVVIRTPMDVRVSADGAVYGSVGRTSSLDLRNAGCGDWTVGNVAGALKVSQAGSGDTVVGSAGSAGLNIAGSGDIATGPVSGALSVSIAGSGDVEVASVGGDLSARIAGSGDVVVRGGQAGVVSASIAGSGDVTFAGDAESLNANIAGSGDVHVARVSGAVSKRVVGSGDVIVGPVDLDD